MRGVDNRAVDRDFIRLGIKINDMLTVFSDIPIRDTPPLLPLPIDATDGLIGPRRPVCSVPPPNRQSAINRRLPGWYGADLKD